MFIHGSKPKSGEVDTLTNIDYFKRYIIIELPKSIENMSCEITVINISSSTGKSRVGIYTSQERHQLTNIYHGHGFPFVTIPNSSLIDIQRYINYESVVFITDISYGKHTYDLSKQRFSELSTTTSYIDMFEGSYGYETCPHVLFYNYEHHTLNEDIKRTRFDYGNVFLNINGYKKQSNYPVMLKDLIDTHTEILVTRSSDYSSFVANKPEYIDYNGDVVDMKTLGNMIIGPITDLIIGLMFNELDFCYDSSDNTLSRIHYTTEHKLSNDIYTQQIHGNCISTFQSNMVYISDFSDWKFRLFVQAKLGNVRIRFIKYDKINGYISKDFNYDVGVFKNAQHNKTMDWICSPLF